MLPSSSTIEASTAPQPTVASTEQPVVIADPNSPPPSLRERMLESVKSASSTWSGVTIDNANANANANAANAQPVAAETQAAAAVTQPPTPPDSTTSATAETQPATTPVATPPDESAIAEFAIPYTPEQLSDTTFWGGLDKAGWDRVTRLHPVETRLVKAAQAAASRIVNAARKDSTAATPMPFAAAADAATPDATTPAAAAAAATESEVPLSSEHQAILDAIDVGTPAERLKAFQQLALMTIETVPEIRATREKESQSAVVRLAHSLAVNGNPTTGLPAFPELDQIDETELGAAYEHDKDAQAIAAIGTPIAIAMAMRKVGQTVLATKRNAAANATAIYEAEQDKLRRNANTPTSNAVRPSPGGPTPTRPQSMLESVQAEWGRVAVRGNQ